MQNYINHIVEYHSFIHFLFYISLLIIIALIIYLAKTRKSIKELIIAQKVLNSLNTKFSGTVFKCNWTTSKRIIKYINNNIYALTGYSSEEIINNKKKHYETLIFPEDLSTLNKKIRNCTPLQNYYQVEYRIHDKNNDEKWILEQGKCSFNKKRVLTKSEGLLTDITQTKYDEQIRQESEKRFQLLIENAPIGICITYNDLITFANPAFLKMFGANELIDIIGNSPLNCIAPDQQLFFKDFIISHKTDLQDTPGIETIGLRKDGTQFPIQIFFTYVMMGDYNATLSFVLDITERKKQENELLSINQRLNDIIELIPDPTFIIDKNKVVKQWNKAIEELTGIKKEEIIGKGNSVYSLPFYGIKTPMLVDLIDEDITNYEKNIENIERSIKKVNNKIFGEFSGQFYQNRYSYLWGVAAPLLDSSGNRFGTIEVIKDITEVKQKEKALLLSEVKSRIILDTNQDFILLINPDNTLLDCNLSFANSIGKTREKLIGKDMSTYFDQETSVYYHQYVKRALETGEIQIFDIIRKNLDYFTIRIYPVKENNNEIKNLVVYAQNTTKLKNAEKALRDSEEEYRTITESITDYLYRVINTNEKISFIFRNPGIEKILGYSISEFKTSPNLFYDIIVADDIEILHSNLNLAIENRENVTFEHRIKHKNGNYIWLSNTLIFTKESTGNKIEFNGVIKDISLRKQFETALKDAEERYRSVFDQSGLATNVFDLDGTLIMQNNLAAIMLGGVPGDFIGKNIEELFSSERVRNIKSNLAETIKKEDVTLREEEINLPTGKYWLKTIAQIVKNTAGQIIGVQFVSQDITARKELDRKILNTIIETEEKERIHFAQELHDGLGPIISAIKMYIQWLSRPDHKLSQNEILRDTEKLINDAGETIREISFKLSPHVLKNFGLIEALQTFSEKVNQSKDLEISLNYNFTSRFEDTIETVIYRILCECINNTIKHANASHITIKILKFITKVRITYTDDGIGFDTQKVFSQKKGNGLFNLQSRLQSINGRCVINSQPGKGVKIMISVKV
jgi:PAS domain S-box-containing protein